MVALVGLDSRVFMDRSHVTDSQTLATRAVELFASATKTLTFDADLSRTGIQRQVGTLLERRYGLTSSQAASYASEVVSASLATNAGGEQSVSLPLRDLALRFDSPLALDKAVRNVDTQLAQQYGFRHGARSMAFTRDVLVEALAAAKAGDITPVVTPPAEPDVATPAPDPAPPAPATGGDAPPPGPVVTIDPVSVTGGLAAIPVPASAPSVFETTPYEMRARLAQATASSFAAGRSDIWPAMDADPAWYSGAIDAVANQLAESIGLLPQVSFVRDIATQAVLETAQKATGKTFSSPQTVEAVDLPDALRMARNEADRNTGRSAFDAIAIQFQSYNSERNDYSAPAFKEQIAALWAEASNRFPESDYPAATRATLIQQEVEIGAEKAYSTASIARAGLRTQLETLGALFRASGPLLSETSDGALKLNGTVFTSRATGDILFSASLSGFKPLDIRPPEADAPPVDPATLIDPDPVVTPVVTPVEPTPVEPPPIEPPPVTPPVDVVTPEPVVEVPLPTPPGSILEIAVPARPAALFETTPYEMRYKLAVASASSIIQARNDILAATNPVASAYESYIDEITTALASELNLMPQVSMVRQATTDAVLKLAATAAGVVTKDYADTRIFLNDTQRAKLNTEDRNYGRSTFDAIAVEFQTFNSNAAQYSPVDFKARIAGLWREASARYASLDLDEPSRARLIQQEVEIQSERDYTNLNDQRAVLLSNLAQLDRIFRTSNPLLSETGRTLSLNETTFTSRTTGDILFSGSMDGFSSLDIRAL